MITNILVLCMYILLSWERYMFLNETLTTINYFSPLLIFSDYGCDYHSVGSVISRIARCYRSSARVLLTQPQLSARSEHKSRSNGGSFAGRLWRPSARSRPVSGAGLGRRRRPWCRPLALQTAGDGGGGGKGGGGDGSGGGVVEVAGVKAV